VFDTLRSRLASKFKFWDFKSTSRLLRGLGLVVMLVAQIEDLAIPTQEINSRAFLLVVKTRFGYTGGLSEQNDASEQNDV
jgi:hypothetical protein